MGRTKTQKEVKPTNIGKEKKKEWTKEEKEHIKELVLKQGVSDNTTCHNEHNKWLQSKGLEVRTYNSVYHVFKQYKGDDDSVSTSPTATLGGKHYIITT